MVKVQIGNHDYYLDGYWRSNMDAMSRDVRKDYDSFILIVAREGFGKSTFAMQSALYVDPTFNLDRVVFTAEQFIEAVDKAKPRQAIVFDETMGYLNSRGALTKFNKALIKVMSEMRSKNLFVFLCIPNFFMMDWYVAQHRTTGLIYIYRRSFFGSYDYPTKKKLYRMGKRHHAYSVPPNFIGRFTKYFPLDQEEYEKKKQQAINEWVVDLSLEKTYKRQRNKLIKYLVKKELLTIKEISKVIKMPVSDVKEIVSLRE